MKRNGLSLRRKTSVTQQDPERLAAKLVAYIVQVRRLQKKHNYNPSDIIAMDETPVWCDMISETTIDKTGKKSITLKTTGDEKARVSVCLAAKADGTKLKPMLVFKGAKREVAALSQEFKHESAPKKNGFAMDYRRLGRVANGCYQEILHMLCVKPSC